MYQSEHGKCHPVNQVANQPCCERQPTDIERILQQLQEQVQRLSGMRNRLMERLEPVLLPSKPSPGRPPNSGIDFPLGQAIKSQANELEEIGDSLQDIIDRLGI